MKILMAIDSVKRGGKEGQFCELLKSLKKYDELSIYLVVRRKIIEYKELHHLGYRIYFPESPSKFKFIFFLNKIINDVKPDIIHSWEAFISSNCILLGMLKKIKIINFDIQYANKISVFSLLYIHEKFNNTFADRNIANTYAGLKIFHLQPSKKNRVIYNGFDMGRILTADTAHLREKLGLKTSLLICMTANFTFPKDFRTLIEAGKRILKKRKDIFFLLIGDGPERFSIQQLVPEEFINHFIFFGKRTDVESIVKEIDIGVLLSKKGHAEGISNSIMEYMAAGKPVIATNAGGNPELIIDQATGYLIPHEDVEGLANKILFLLDNPKKSEEMGRKGKERIEKEFSLNKMVNQFLKLYEEVICNESTIRCQR